MGRNLPLGARRPLIQSIPQGDDQPLPRGQAGLDTAADFSAGVPRVQLLQQVVVHGKYVHQRQGVPIPTGLQQEVRTLQQKLNKTFVFVTHDMAEALDLADVIIFMDHGRIVQMAPPEEMLSHPASGQIQDFLGKFIDLQAHKELTAADFMRTGVYTVSTRKGINECISKMQRHNVDTLIVVDDQARYQGTVSIADIRLTGHVVQTIEPLIRCNTPTVHAEDNAKDCFDQLISSGAPYLVVLDGQGQVAGIITKTSMASAMAEQLWG